VYQGGGRAKTSAQDLLEGVTSGLEAARQKRVKKVAPVSREGMVLEDEKEEVPYSGRQVGGKIF